MLCVYDSDCSEGFHCINAFCFEKTHTPCTLDAQCGKGNACDAIDRVCTEGGAVCTGDSECGDRQSCLSRGNCNPDDTSGTGGGA